LIEKNKFRFFLLRFNYYKNLQLYIETFLGYLFLYNDKKLTKYITETNVNFVQFKNNNKN